MPIKINSIKHYNDFRPEGTDYLLHNVMGYVRTEIDFTAYEQVLSSTDKVITCNNKDGYIGDGWITDPLSRFSNFKTGDTVRVGNYVTSTTLGNFTIISKLSNGVIQLDSDIPLLGDNFPSEQLVFSITVPITAANFQYNFIENSEGTNFISKVDGSSIHLMTAELIDAGSLSVVSMNSLTQLPASIGNSTIQGLGITNTYYYESRFKIIHYTYLTPFIDAILTSGITTSTPPLYYNLTKCLKYCFKIQALYDYTDPNRKQEITKSDILGNTGWFNENFNGEPSEFSIDSVVYKKSDNITVIPSLELTTSDQYVEITVKSENGVFSDNNTEFALTIIKAPYDTSEYTANARPFAINFCFDRAFNTVGSPSVNGIFFSTTNQSLKAVSGTFVDAFTVKINFRVDYASQVISILNESEQPRFLIALETQDHSKPSASSDRVQLLVDLDTFFIDNSDPGMIGNETLFLRHYESEPDTEGVEIVEAFPFDEIVARSRFYIDTNGRESDVIRIQNIYCRIKAKNLLTLEDFTMDSFSLNVSASPVISDGTQYINSSVNRPFHIPTTEIRRPFSVKRRDDLDAGGFVYFDVMYPFFMRWEYYVPLPTANADFFDPTKPNNNLNHFWHKYSLGNWRIYYEIQVTALKNGVLQGYTFESQINSNNVNSNRQKWFPNSIKSYDNDTNVELADYTIPKKYVQGYKSSRIEAVFTRAGGFTLDLSNLVMAIHAGRWENDTFTGVRRFSSVWSMTSDTWFKSVDTSNKIKLTLPAANQVKGELLLDHTTIPSFESLTIYARIYEKTEPEYNEFKINEDGTFKTNEIGDYKILD